MPSTTFVDLSRFQFARTAAFDMTFPALSVGLSIFLVICCRGARRLRDRSAAPIWSRRGFALLIQG
jgi:cytochrome bd-type quinol oxidase subunit 1